MLRRAVFFVLTCVLTLLVFGFPLTCSAQSDIPVLGPHKPIAPRISAALFANQATMPRTIVGGPWLLDPNMKSTLFLHNNNEVTAFLATPVLYLSNGRQITLPAVSVGPAATVTVSIGDSLLGQGIAPYANLTGYAEIQYNASYDPLCATVVSVDTVHSVIFTYGFRSTAPVPMTEKAKGHPTPSLSYPSGPQRIDGVWWKQSASVSGFISLSNTTAQSINAQLAITGADGVALGAYPVALSPHTTQTVNLLELKSGSSTSGGAQITYTAPQDSLLISGGLEDLATGYSATMSFRPFVAITPATKTTTLTELGLMTGTPDPMMLFPQGTVFTPFSVVRNVSSDPVALTPELFWMQAGAMHRQALPAFTISAGQSSMMNVPSLLQQAGLTDYNGVLNLTFKTASSPQALILTSGSVDNTGTYVFQVIPHEVRESMSKTITYWSTGNGNDTMVTVWNPADEAQDYNFTLQYKDGAYVLPLHLAPRATTSLSVASLIRDQTPDVNGVIIPTTITEGSARISGIHADNEFILVDMDAGTYNVRKGTCSYYCVSCNGAISALIGEPVDFSMHGSQQLNFIVQQNTGGAYNYSSQATWSSSNSGIATIATYGMASAVAVGNFTADASADLPLDGQECAYNESCPDNGFMQGSGGGTVNNYNLTVTGSTPVTFGGSGPITITGTGFSQFTSAPTVTMPGVTISNAIVQSATTITATYQSSCSATIGSSPSGLIVQFTAPDGTTPQGNGPYSIVLPNIPPPIISGAPQSAVVGQQIALTVSAPSLPNCVTFYNPMTGGQTFYPQWGTPTGTAVGGYTANNSSASVSALPSATASSYNFYWTTPGNPLQQTVKYYYAAWGYGAWSPNATASVNVVGPTSATVTVNTGQEDITPGLFLAFGGVPTNIGISFAASATPPSGYSNSFEWVQLITHDVSLLTPSSGAAVLTCTPTTQPVANTGTGLDTEFPYATGSTTNDNPRIGLSATYKEISRSFTATMYLLWNSGLSNSIPIPLGYVAWQSNGDAVLTNSGSNTWSLKSGSGSSNSFQTSSSLPQWSSFVPYTGGLTCH